MKIEAAAFSIDVLKSRERLIAETLVQLADTLVSDYDPTEMSYLLVDSCRSVLEVDHAGLMLKHPSGGLQVVAATSEATHLVELLQIQNDEGPCLDAVNTGEPVVTGPLNAPEAAERWPHFVEATQAAGFTAVTALPMRLRHDVIGALNLFFVEHRPSDSGDVAVAQAFADIGTIAILQYRASDDARHVVDQLQSALDSRILIEQAKGRVAQHANVDMDAGFAMIRGYARNHSLRLSAVAAELVAGTLDPSTLART